MKKKCVILTGGHHSSALVLAKRLCQQDIIVHWFGHKYTMRGVKNTSAEYREINLAGIPFYNIWTGKFHGGSIIDFLKLPVGFLQALLLIIKIRPCLIVSFGGYLSVPVVLAAWLLRIPAVTHEQTATAGKANRLLKHFVRKIFITFEESRKFFPTSKTVLIGLPLSHTVFSPDEKPIFEEKLPIIMVTGGKQGSHVINKTIEEILLKLLTRYNLFHQVGETSFTGDLIRLKKKRESLPAKLKKRYRVVGYVGEELFVRALKQANLIITRAGAHTVYKLIFFKKKAILIPLPLSFDQEQEKNAQILEKLGLGIVLPQKKLTGGRLLKLIESFIKENPSRESISKVEKLIKPNATTDFLRGIEEFIR